MCILAGSFELIYFLKISLKYLINQYHIINDVKHGQVTGKSGLCKLAHFFYQNTFITCNINASILPLLLYTKESSYSLIIKHALFSSISERYFYVYIYLSLRSHEHVQVTFSDHLLSIVCQFIYKHFTFCQFYNISDFWINTFQEMQELLVRWARSCPLFFLVLMNYVPGFKKKNHDTGNCVCLFLTTFCHWLKGPRQILSSLFFYLISFLLFTYELNW